SEDGGRQQRRPEDRRDGREHDAELPATRVGGLCAVVDPEEDKEQAEAERPERPAGGPPSAGEPGQDILPAGNEGRYQRGEDRAESTHPAGEQYVAPADLEGPAEAPLVGQQGREGSPGPHAEQRASKSRGGSQYDALGEDEA